MAVLDWIAPEPGLLLEDEGVRLRPPRMADYPAWAELRRESRAFLQPWEPTWPADDLTRAAFRRRSSRGPGSGSWASCRSVTDVRAAVIVLSSAGRREW